MCVPLARRPRLFLGRSAPRGCPRSCSLRSAAISSPSSATPSSYRSPFPCPPGTPPCSSSWGLPTPSTHLPVLHKTAAGESVYHSSLHSARTRLDLRHLQLFTHTQCTSLIPSFTHNITRNVTLSLNLSPNLTLNFNMNFHSGGLHGSTFTRSGPGPALAVSWDWGTDGERASPRKLTAVKALAGLVSKVCDICVLTSI